jgi:hypothetical protein
MKLLSEFVIEEFYKPFTSKCHALGAYSRAQCSGAPCDIISAYATVDVPESEALLYEPSFANIVASAAALSGKPVVTSETFTCLYGWPRDHHSQEQTADLKLLADALFANGVNQIVWHGKPLNPAGQDTVKFYASVHVGKSGALAREIPAFNQYMERISKIMKMGKTWSGVAVYLPVEDAWVAGELPVEKQFIWSWGEYEMRYSSLPEALQPWRPLWINSEFLQKAVFRNGSLKAGDLSFSALYVDVNYLDISALKRITELAEQGLPVCLARTLAEPGMNQSPEVFVSMLKKLMALPGVKRSWQEVKKIPPLVTGCNESDFWCRETDDGIYLFFANPKSRRLTFPMNYGQSLNDKPFTCETEIRYHGMISRYTLEFQPGQSRLIFVSKAGSITPVDITFKPEIPVFQPRIKKGKEKWEVDVQKK